MFMAVMHNKCPSCNTIVPPVHDKARISSIKRYCEACMQNKRARLVAEFTPKTKALDPLNVNYPVQAIQAAIPESKEDATVKGIVHQAEMQYGRPGCTHRLCSTIIRDYAVTLWAYLGAALPGSSLHVRRVSIEDTLDKYNVTDVHELVAAYMPLVVTANECLARNYNALALRVVVEELIMTYLQGYRLKGTSRAVKVVTGWSPPTAELKPVTTDPMAVTSTLPAPKTFPPTVDAASYAVLAHMSQHEPGLNKRYADLVLFLNQEFQVTHHYLRWHFQLLAKDAIACAWKGIDQRFMAVDDDELHAEVLHRLCVKYMKVRSFGAV